MTAKEIFIKINENIYHVPEMVVSFYDPYIRGEVEIYPPSDSWIGNMSVDIATYLRNKKNIKSGEFSYCNKLGKIINKTKFSVKLRWENSND